MCFEVLVVYEMIFLRPFIYFYAFFAGEMWDTACYFGWKTGEEDARERGKFEELRWTGEG